MGTLADVAVAGPATAPTAEETFRWLRGKLRQVVSYEVEGKRIVRTIDPIVVSDCQLYFIDSSKVDDGQWAATGFRLKFSDLNPAGIHLEQWGEAAWAVFVETTDGRFVVESFKLKLGTKDVPPPKERGYMAATWVLAPTEELANRISRAMRHATNLCGGKVDPF